MRIATSTGKEINDHLHPSMAHSGHNRLCICRDDNRMRYGSTTEKGEMMKVAYIAGAYRAPTVNGIYENIQRAREVALKYWKLGYAVICPHLNSAFMDGACPDHVWLEGDLEILKRCDVIVLLPGWELSKGAKREREVAVDAGLIVIGEP